MQNKAVSIVGFLASSYSLISHGDLHSENVLWTGSDYSIIDLDHAAYHPFFYDLMKFMADRVSLIASEEVLFDSVAKGSFQELNKSLNKLWENGSGQKLTGTLAVSWLAMVVYYCYWRLSNRGASPQAIRASISRRFFYNEKVPFLISQD